MQHRAGTPWIFLFLAFCAFGIAGAMVILHLIRIAASPPAIYLTATGYVFILAGLFLGFVGKAVRPDPGDPVRGGGP